MTLGVEEFDEFWREKNSWSAEAFGQRSERGPIGPLKHLKKEVEEALAAPDDPMEIVDCFFLVTDAAWRQGLSLEKFMKLCWQKLAINKGRTWPKPEKDEVSEHVR